MSYCNNAYEYVRLYLAVCFLYQSSDNHWIGHHGFVFESDYEEGYDIKSNCFFDWGGWPLEGFVSMNGKTFCIVEGEVVREVEFIKNKRYKLNIRTDLDIELFLSILHACIIAEDQDTFDKMYPKIAEQFFLEELEILLD